MKIKKIEIKNFGKLNDFFLTFNGNFEKISQPNEYGKTTIIDFIKIMLYSRFCGEKAGVKDREFRNKYSPWNGEKMSGAIEFETEGFTYRAEKQISTESPAKDRVSLYNKSTGEPINLGKKGEIGEHFFNLDLKSFERTSFIGEIRGAITSSEKNSSDPLTDKIISNLAETGEENFSGGEVLNRIEEAIKDLEQTRGNGGKILNTEKEISKLKQELIFFQNYEEQQNAYKEQLQELKINLSKKNILKEVIDFFESKKEFSKLQKLLNLKNENSYFLDKIQKKNLDIEKTRCLCEKLRLKQKEIEFFNLKIFESEKKLESLNDSSKPIFLSDLNSKKEELKEKENEFQKKSKNFFIIRISVFIILFVLASLAFAKESMILAAIAISSGLSFAFFLLKDKNSKDNALKNLNVEIQNFFESFNCKDENEYQIKCLKHEEYLNSKKILNDLILKLGTLKNEFQKEFSVYEIIKDYSLALKIFECLSLELEGYLKKESEIQSVFNILGMEDISEKILNYKLNKLESKIKSFKMKIGDKFDISETKIQFENLQKMELEKNIILTKNLIKPPEKSVYAIENELKLNEEKLVEMNKYLVSLKMAKENAEKACSELRMQFGPELDEKASQIFSKLTGNKYKNLHIQKDFKILVEKDFSVKNCEYFSGGTIDQAYLALRIAVSELISKKAMPPLIMDDSLMQYDDERLNLALNFLKNYGAKNQIILFSCRN